MLHNMSVVSYHLAPSGTTANLLEVGMSGVQYSERATLRYLYTEISDGLVPLLEEWLRGSTREINKGHLQNLP